MEKISHFTYSYDTNGPVGTVLISMSVLVGFLLIFSLWIPCVVIFPLMLILNTLRFHTSIVWKSGKIIQHTTILKIPLKKWSKTYQKENFNLAKVYQFSEKYTGSVAISSVSSGKRYYVVELLKKGNSAPSIVVCKSKYYVEALNTAKYFKERYSYQVVDLIKERLQQNRRDIRSGKVRR